MTSCLRRHVIWCSGILLLLAYIQATEQAPMAIENSDTAEVGMDSNGTEEDGSSSEETVEDVTEIIESERRRRRSMDADSSDRNADGLSPRVSIPGVPDPATIVKIAEILQTVEDQIIPAVIEGMATPILVVTEKLNNLNKNFKFLRNLRNQLGLGQSTLFNEV